MSTLYVAFSLTRIFLMLYFDVVEEHHVRFLMDGKH
jgi:hypothetical protein